MTEHSIIEDDTDDQLEDYLEADAERRQFERHGMEA
jgi:hypothetical protein